MSIGTEGTALDEALPVGDLEFKNVTKFKYLGAQFTGDNDVSSEVTTRLQCGNKAYFVLRRLLTSRLVSRKMKLRIYNTIIRPVVLYGCEGAKFVVLRGGTKSAFSCSKIVSCGVSLVLFGIPCSVGRDNVATATSVISLSYMIKEVSLSSKLPSGCYFGQLLVPDCKI